MPPIYETDIAEERWNKSEWNHYELWEKVEVRLKRHKRLWILGTILVFLALSSVPIVVEQRPKWQSLGAARRLGQEVNRIKRQAGIDHSAYRIVFPQDGKLIYRVEKASSCADLAGQWVRTESLVPEAAQGDYVLLSRSKGIESGVPGLVESFCYDPLTGNDGATRGENTVGFAVAPVKDLSENRLDRMAILLLSGPSAEVSFE